jgi:hypothetical protein
MFEVDLGRIKFKWMGVWAAVPTYAVDDVVYHSGTTYIAVAVSTGVVPSASASEWDIMAIGSDLGSIAQSAGDMFYYDGVNFQKLSSGANGQVLKVGNNNSLSWVDPSLLSPVIQTKIYTDYVRTNVNAGNVYYFGQSSTGLQITPRRLDSIIEIGADVFGELSGHDGRYAVQYSVNNGSSWQYMRYNPGNQWTHGKFNVYESDYSSTPGSNSITLAQSFQTLQPVLFRIYIISNNMTFNGSRSASYEHGQSTFKITELNVDHNTLTYNGGT